MIQSVGCFRDFFRGGVGKTQKFRRRNAGRPAVKLGAQRPVGGDGQNADVGILRTAGRAINVLSVLILHDDLLRIVAVSVQPGINACSMGDDIGVHPGRDLFLISHMSYDDHVIGPLRPPLKIEETRWRKNEGKIKGQGS